MSGKFALIIGNAEYTDPGLAQLTAPGKDAEDFARVLNSTDICAFDHVNILLNQPEFVVREAIDEFFDQKKPDDLLVLYFSGHGVRDELGALYLAVKNTNRFRLRSTAIKSDFIREAMDQSRSKRQVLIMDCCNSGAFAQGTKAATGVSIGTASAFEAGYGRIIMTASDSTQFAWEGDRVMGETDNSLFTHFLVEGLEGEADMDGDGRITVDELYDYAYEKVRVVTPKQTPSKFSSKQQGEIVLRQITRIQDIKPVSLSDQLVSEIENPYPEVRLRAVQQLTKLLTGKNLGLARSAREALERMEEEDDSRRVAQAATQVLESFRQVEQKAEEERKAREEADRLAILNAEEDGLAPKKAEAERRAKEEVERLARARAEREREAVEQEAARLKAEREAAEKAAREAAQKAAKEKAEKEAREREAMELAARRKAAREAAKRESARLMAELLAYRKAVWDKITNYLRNIPKNKSKIYTFLGLAIAFVAVVTFLVYQLSPNITPNNNALPFSGVSAREVNVYWYDDEKVTKLTQSQEGVKNWGPTSYTSRRIYFTSDRSGKAEIYVLINEANEGKVLRITDTAGEAESWSPVVSLSGHVYFTSDRSGKAEIYALTNKGKLLQITDTPGEAESWSPAVSLSGHVYFTSDRSGKAEIYALTNKGKLLQITYTPGEAESWSPVIRGQNTFFTSNRSGKNKVYILAPQARATAISTFESWTERWANPFPHFSP